MSPGRMAPLSPGIAMMAPGGAPMMMALPPGAHMGGGRGMPAHMGMPGMVAAMPPMPVGAMPPPSPGRYPGQQQAQQRSPRSSGGYASREGEHRRDRLRWAGCTAWCCRLAWACSPRCRTACLLTPAAPSPVLSPAALPTLSSPAAEAAAVRRRAAAMCQVAGVGEVGAEAPHPAAIQAAVDDVRSGAAFQESAYADSVQDYVRAPQQQQQPAQ